MTSLIDLRRSDPQGAEFVYQSRDKSSEVCHVEDIALSKHEIYLLVKNFPIYGSNTTRASRREKKQKEKEKEKEKKDKSAKKSNLQKITTNISVSIERVLSNSDKSTKKPARPPRPVDKLLLAYKKKMYDDDLHPGKYYSQNIFFSVHISSTQWLLNAHTSV